MPSSARYATIVGSVVTISSAQCDFSFLRENETVDLTRPAIMQFTASHVKWDPESLIREYPDVMLGVGHPDYVLVGYGTLEERLTIPEFMAQLPFQGKHNYSVVFESGEFMYRPEMQADVEPPPNLKMAAGGEFKFRSILSMGGPGSGLGFHMHPATFLKLHVGSKLWLVYPPGQSPSQVSMWDELPSAELESLTSELPKSQQPIRCLQKPGELVYLPKGYMHATLNGMDTTATIGVGGQGSSKEAMQSTLDLAESATKEGRLDLKATLYAAMSHTFRLRDYDAGLLYARQARKIRPNNMELYLIFSEIYFKKGETSSALSELQEAYKILEGASDKAENFRAGLLFQIGWRSLFRLRNLGLAKRALDASYNLRQSSIPVCVARAYCAYEMGQARKASEMIRCVKGRISILSQEVREKAELLIQKLFEKIDRENRKRKRDSISEL